MIAKLVLEDGSVFTSAFGGGRGRIQYGHGRLSGMLYGSLVRGSDFGADLSAHWELRRTAAWPAELGVGLSAEGLGVE